MAKFEVMISIEGNRTIEAKNADAAQAIAEENVNISGLDYWEITESEVENLDKKTKEDK